MANIDFAFIVKDNEKAAQTALDRGDYLQAFILIHTLLESLMRVFLKLTDENLKFHQLIERWEDFLKHQHSGIKSFVKELTEINRRRNRIVHELWGKGYTFTNRQAKDAAIASIQMYSLFIEFLQTYSEDLEEQGFRPDEGK